MFRHPNYYKELRKRNKSDQAISPEAATAAVGVRPGPGHKPQASSDTTASGLKLQATSSKLQAPSSPSNKRQASSHVAQASRFKPKATRSKILDPRKSFTVQGPRASTMINELLGCLTWKLI